MLSAHALNFPCSAKATKSGDGMQVMEYAYDNSRKLNHHRTSALLGRSRSPIMHCIASSICYFSLCIITLRPFLVSREVCGEAHYTGTHITSINVFNINLEVLHVFPLLVPSLLDAVGHCIVHACYEEWMWNYCVYVWTELRIQPFTNHSADAKGH